MGVFCRKKNANPSFPLFDLHRPWCFQPGASVDPWDNSSCTGGPLNLASKLPPGVSQVVLRNYTNIYQKRLCNSFSGCTAWEAATPSYGPSGTGSVWIRVVTAGLIISIVDSRAGSSSGQPAYKMGMDCALKNGMWDCGRYRDTEVREGINFLKFGGSGKFSGVELPFGGYVNARCARFFGSVATSKVANQWTEYRG